MGNVSSRSTKTTSTPNGETIGGGMARGKTSVDEKTASVEIIDSVTFSSDEEYLMTESDASYESEEEEDDEEEDEDMMERLRILDDARRLKQLAEAFLYPERLVVATSETAGRCYFDRASAPEVQEEELLIMEDAIALKKLAVEYAHPERSVVTTDEYACGRLYFDRPSAPEQESVEEVEERARILEDARALKKQAVDYLHPEMAVVTIDAMACSRNYFIRASAVEQEDEEQAKERDLVMQDLVALKKLATDYLHPELPVVTTDEMATARNFFGRASATDMETMKEAEERARIMEETMALKKLAVDYAHPELGVVTTDEHARGRAFFDRASAPEQESMEEAEERARILEDARALKQLGVDYLHPEKAVVTTDENARGRNYFDRPSAPVAESVEHVDECELVMKDLRALKQLATDYAHPELSVFTTEDTACGRLYFNRASAVEQEDEEQAKERDLVMQDLIALKRLATDYLHPELPVVTTDASLFGRDYFGRFSSPDQVSVEEAEEYNLFLVDAMGLEKFATDYLHPELPVVTTDASCTGRNYFDRASAEETEYMEEAQERTLIMEEVKMLKKLAIDYAHPELPVKTSDALSCGRNYFARPTAPGHTCISSTHEQDVKIINDDEEDYFMDDCDLEFGKFEEDVLTDWKYQVHKMLDRSHYAAANDTRPMTKEEEEGKLSRSPSSVMLFQGYA